jgi:hypothetical protein
MERKMPAVSRDRKQIRDELIRRVGPWAFQSYPKNEWKNVSDRELICGALLKANPEDRYLLLDLYDVNKIREVWQRYAVVQDDWFHASNVWAAKNIFKAANPEQFVKAQLRKSHRMHIAGQLGY